jgi:hypothetical protein
MYQEYEFHSVSLFAVSWKSFCNASPDTWEKKTALALVPQRMNASQLRFQPYPNGGYGVDDVSILPAPIDPAVSPTQSVVTPSLGQCAISWRTPADPAIASIMVRQDNGTHPVAADSGSLLTSVAAQPGAGQQVSVPFDWTSRSYAFFSVFGIKAGRSFTPHDLASVKIDKTPPTTPTVDCWQPPDATTHAQWSSSEPDSSIVQYRYAVGTGSGCDNIRNWTYTTDTSVVIAGLPIRTTFYVSVKAQNTFGFWSDAGSTAVPGIVSAANVLTEQDGYRVATTGIVSAVFGDCFYLQDPVGTRGIKVLGNVSEFHEGHSATVSGTLTTVNGERCIQQ